MHFIAAHQKHVPSDMPSPPQYPPEADFNLERSIDVETTTPVPLSLPELASRVKTAEELTQNLPELSAKEVEVLEHHTHGQGQSTDCLMISEWGE